LPNGVDLSQLVISLDFELFWGVSDSRTINAYGKNIEGVWRAVPALLSMFHQYDVRATWATVGMLMCRNYAQWRDIRPSTLPKYLRSSCSTYELDATVSENPKLFFARPLVEKILDTQGQELASHTYSHFFCGEEGATPQQFAADLDCANELASEIGVSFRSLVFPRNQIDREYLVELPKAGIKVYRGNPDHWLYRDGHFTPAGIAGRVVRFADSWVPVTGDHTTSVMMVGGLINVPASLLFRPWSHHFRSLESLRLHRLKEAMTTAARTGRVCHLWWHRRARYACGDAGRQHSVVGHRWRACLVRWHHGGSDAAHSAAPACQ
jgi:hypothetical protein